MALTAASALHYWSSRFESVPVVGGKPVHSRNSIAAWIDQKGELQTAPVNTPRFEWATIDSERRKVMRLEQSRTNNLTYSSDFANAAWTKSNITVTTGEPDPSGGTGAGTLTATVANGYASQNRGVGSSAVRMNTLWIKRRTGSGTIELLDPLGSVWTAMGVTAGWTRFAKVGGAGTGQEHGIRIVTSGDAVDVYLAKQEVGATVSSEIATTSAAVTRSADSFYWNCSPNFQALMAYVRFVERGTVGQASGTRLIDLGNSATIRFLLYTGGTFYMAYHENTGPVSATLAAAPAVGDVVELVGVLNTDGSVEVIQSINGAAITSAGPSATTTISSATSMSRLYLNSDHLGTNAGLNDFAEIKIVKYADVAGATAQARMDELRQFELNQAGEVI